MDEGFHHFHPDEAFRLHLVHCGGCSEYNKHGGAWKTDKTASRLDRRDAGFDSPPPPPSQPSDDAFTWHGQYVPKYGMVINDDEDDGFDGYNG